MKKIIKHYPMTDRLIVTRGYSLNKYIVLLLLNSQVTSLWHYEWKRFVKYCGVNVIIKCEKKVCIIFFNIQSTSIQQLMEKLFTEKKHTRKKTSPIIFNCTQKVIWFCNQSNQKQRHTRYKHTDAILHIKQ